MFELLFFKNLRKIENLQKFSFSTIQFNPCPCWAMLHMLQMLLASKINSHISSNFCPDHQDGRWIIKPLTAN